MAAALTIHELARESTTTVRDLRAHAPHGSPQPLDAHARDGLQRRT